MQGIGWAVKPEGEIDFPPAGVPYVKRELNWVRVAQRFPVRIEVENPGSRSFPHGRVRSRDHQRSATEIIPMSATFLEARPSDSDWIGWLKRELAPTRAREIRTAILVGGVVLCVIISMALQVPELAVTAYIVFFVSKETKPLTTLTGVSALIGVPLRRRQPPSLQVHLRLSRIAYSRDSHRAFPWNVVVAHLS